MTETYKQEEMIMRTLKEIALLDDSNEKEKVLHGEIVNGHSLELLWNRGEDVYCLRLRRVQEQEPYYVAEYRNVKVSGEIVAAYRELKRQLVGGM